MCAVIATVKSDQLELSGGALPPLLKFWGGWSPLCPPCVSPPWSVNISSHNTAVMWRVLSILQVLEVGPEALPNRGYGVES